MQTVYMVKVCVGASTLHLEIHDLQNVVVTDLNRSNLGWAWSSLEFNTKSDQSQSWSWLLNQTCKSVLVVPP